MSLWYNCDITTYESSKINDITSWLGLQQIIKEHTHIIGDSLSCVDLTFTTQQNVIKKSGVHTSLHANCHHPIIFEKFSLKIHYSFIAKPGIVKSINWVSSGQSFCKYQGKLTSGIMYSDHLKYNF